MEIQKYRAGHELQEVFDIKKQIDELSNKVLGGGSSVKMDLYDLGDSFQLIFELAGVEQENIELSVRGDEVVLAGNRIIKDENKKVLLSERPRGKFQRKIKLPGPVKEDKSTAYQKDGLLILNLKKDLTEN